MFVFPFSSTFYVLKGYGTASTGLPKGSVELKKALGPRISQLLETYVNLALGSARRDGSSAVDVEHLQVLGGVAIDYCVSIGRSDILFRSIYLQFCKVGGDGGLYFQHTRRVKFASCEIVFPFFVFVVGKRSSGNNRTN